MNNQEIVERLDKVSQTLNGIGGRLIVAAMMPGARPEVKEAHRMTLELGASVDDLINELMAEEDNTDA